MGFFGFAVCLGQSAANHWILHPVGTVQIPGVTGSPGAAAWLMVGQIGTGFRVVGALKLPGYQPVFYKYPPGTGACAIDPMRGAHYLIVLPAVAVKAFPVTGRICSNHMLVGAYRSFFAKINKFIE